MELRGRGPRKRIRGGWRRLRRMERGSVVGLEWRVVNASWCLSSRESMVGGLKGVVGEDRGGRVGGGEVRSDCRRSTVELSSSGVRGVSESERREGGRSEDATRR